MYFFKYFKKNVCVCMRVCVCERQSKREGERKGTHLHAREEFKHFKSETISGEKSWAQSSVVERVTLRKKKYQILFLLFSY